MKLGPGNESWFLSLQLDVPGACKLSKASDPG
jgi:hypothetical protein